MSDWIRPTGGRMSNQIRPSNENEEAPFFVSLPRAKQRVIDTVKNLGLRVLPADVVSKTGLPLQEATRLLNTVASETRATLEVSAAGDIYYCFAPGFENTYTRRGFERAVMAFASTMFRLAFYALRISFGLMLVISLIVVVVLIVVCIIALMSGDSGGGGGDVGGGGGGGDFFNLDGMGDAFTWNYTDSHQQKIEHYGVTQKTWRPKQQIKKGNFFLECFSFLFGDGDPNSDLDEYKWILIGEVIRRNNYVVVAEQMAPYTGKPAQDDSGMLEILARFDGKPVVTDSGNIVYVFESLQRQYAATPIERQSFAPLPAFLEEAPWKFSEYPAPSLVLVLIFASLNFAGSWWLFKHIATIALLQHFVVLIDVLLAYGALFLLIPFLRIIFNAFMNLGISARNAERSEFADAVGSKEVRAKMLEAYEIAGQIGYQSVSEADKSKVIYTTQKDALEQQFEQL